MNLTDVRLRMHDELPRKHEIRRHAVGAMEQPMDYRWPVIDDADIARWVNEGGALGREEKSFLMTLHCCGTEHAYC